MAGRVGHNGRGVWDATVGRVHATGGAWGMRQQDAWDATGGACEMQRWDAWDMTGGACGA